MSIFYLFYSDLIQEEPEKWKNYFNGFQYETSNEEDIHDFMGSIENQFNIGIDVGGDEVKGVWYNFGDIQWGSDFDEIAFKQKKVNEICDVIKKLCKDKGYIIKPLTLEMKKTIKEVFKELE